VNSGWVYFSFSDYCSAPWRDSVFIQVNKIPEAEFKTGTHRGCSPLVIAPKPAVPENGNRFLWDFGDGTADSSYNPIKAYVKEGRYIIRLRVTSPAGCVNEYSSSDTIDVWPSPVAGFSVEPKRVNIENPEIHITNQSKGGNKYSWDFGDGTMSSEKSPVHRYSDTGIYKIRLQVKNKYGCVDSAAYKFPVNDIFRIQIPNVFTPGNGDAVNPVFQPVGTYIQTYTMSIYNRWGERVFLTESSEAWDGRFHGKIVQQDIYLYTISVTDRDGTKSYYKGTVQVLR
jgi:gliding motility-associated-like protein